MENIILKVRDLKKSRKSKNGIFNLDNISFNLFSKQITALVGLNGAGKTTLIKLILGLLQADSGSIVFNSNILNGNAIKKINYLPENFIEINYEHTVGSLLRFFCNLNSIPDSEIEKKVDSTLTIVGLINHKTQLVSKLSKGMKTRLGIAQALIGEPILLILDEPTDGLDPQGRKDIINLIKNLKRNDLAILISSHILSEVENLADNILILHKGKLLANSPIEQLISQNTTEKNYLENYFFRTINNENKK